MNQLPKLDNLAWAPVPAIENIEVLDRFNGVPTLGVYSAGGEQVLFWRVIGYVPKRFSVWLYVPVGAAEQQHLSCCEPDDLLTGLLFNSPAERYVAVGLARDGYRLLFEREWNLPAGMEPDSVVAEVLEFLVESLGIALQQDLPYSRLEMMRSASQAVRELAAASC